MNDLHPTEEKFEAYIEQHLQSIGYQSKHYSEYDRSLCLIREDLIEFIRRSQPENWKRLENSYGADEVEAKLLARISKSISSHGIVEVLRNPLADRGVYFNLCYFKPKSGMNPDHQDLYQANRFTVVRQLHYSVLNEKSTDMAIFVNGLPIVTIELKNQLTGQTIVDSQKQYQEDRDPKESLFKFKRCIAHFCVDNDKASMTTKLNGTKTVFLPYNKDLENPAVEQGYRTSYIWQGVLTPDSLLDILENFVHVSEEKSFHFNENTERIETKKTKSLIFPRYHQLDLIRKLRRQVKRDGVGTNYLVQHTTGSGKSYSIGWLSHALTSLYQHEDDPKRMFDTIVVVTDRKVLDNQLRSTILSLEKTGGVVGGVEQGSKELKEFLEKGKDIVVTTIQKFPFISDTIAELQQNTFAVIVDEVHSSQSGEMNKELKKALSVVEDDGEYDYEEMLAEVMASRGKQANISFFGFTGTPKEKTLEVFGTKNSADKFEPYHIYSMQQSIHERFTLDVLENYTTYKRYLKLNKVCGDEMKLPVAKATAKLLNYVDSHETTIEYKVKIMLNHWIEKGSKQIEGRARAMIVTQSRQHCVQYFWEVNKQLQELGMSYRALVAFSGEVGYAGDSFTEVGLNGEIGHNGDIPLGLKNPKFRLLIIANKFQTGFDEPLVQTMYVDKVLRGVQCVQTLSRLNRTMRGKTAAFVLDFVNSVDVVRESFQRFYTSTMLDGESDPNAMYDTKSAIEQFRLYASNEVDEFCRAFFDPDRDESELHSVLDQVVDKYLLIDDEEEREDFKSKIQKYIRMYGYMSQIITFKDIELEKANIFLKFLNRKLPKRDTEKFDLSSYVDLDSLRIQKSYEKMEGLIDETHVDSPPEFEEFQSGEPERDSLSEIVRQLNDRYGLNLSEDDKLNIERVQSGLLDDTKIQMFMEGDSSNENKKVYFREQFDQRVLATINDSIEFYKKLENNPSAKNMIFQILLADYQKQRDLSA